MKSKEEIIIELKNNIKRIVSWAEPLDAVSWSEQYGIIISANTAQIIVELLELQQPKKETKTIEERHSDFFWNVKYLLDKHRNQIDGVDVVDFVNYWTEISPNAKKMRFEKEKVFDIKKRLERWKRNQKTFNNGNQQQSTTDALNKFITE